MKKKTRTGQRRVRLLVDLIFRWCGMRRTISPMLTKKLVITDADGTLWSFWDYFVPAMQAVIPVIAAKLSDRSGREVSFEDVSWELGRVMTLRGTHEWPWVWEESKFWQDPQWRKLWVDYSEFNREIVDPFWRELDDCRQRYLRLFDDVLETLLTLRHYGVSVVIQSDAPFHMARARIFDMGISELITAAYALETPMPPPESNLSQAELAYGLERVERFSALPLKCRMVKMPKHWEKPSRRGMAQILEDAGVKPEEAVMVGDSLPRDGGVAQANGVAYLWARYGVHLPSMFREMIDEKFMPPDMRPHRHRRRVYPPMLGRSGAAEWSAVLEHLGPEPLPLHATRLNQSADAEACESCDK